MKGNTDAVNEILNHLGAFVACWAQTETSLNYWLTRMLIADEKYANMFVSTIPSRVKIERAEALAITHFPNESTTIKTLFGDLDKLRVKRNDYVHGVWRTVEEDNEQGNHKVNALAPKQPQVTAVLKQIPFTLNDLSSDIEKIQKTTEEIKALFTRLGLFSSRYTPPTR